jgi:bacteriocin-like protein
MNNLNTESRELTIDELQNVSGGGFFDRITAYFTGNGTGLAHLASLAAPLPSGNGNKPE